MKIIINLFFLIVAFAFLQAQTTDPNLLVNIQKASQAEIDAYNVADLEIGMLVYNTDENRVFEYTDVGFLEILTSLSIDPTVYTGFFIISAEGVTTVTGIPFEPSQVTFVAHANVESLDLDSDNGTGNNERGIENSHGTMNGFARNIGGTLTQQVIYIGAHGNSINDISRYASSSNCIGLRYGDQNGFDLGKIEGAFGGFTADGFTINVNYTDGVIDVDNANILLDVQPDEINNEAIVVMYTAYR